jgi:hypothetical protein
MGHGTNVGPTTMSRNMGNDINPCETGEVAIWHHFRLSDWTTFHRFRFYSSCAGNTIPPLSRIYGFILPTLCNTEQLSVLGLLHISDCIRHIKAILAEKGLFYLGWIDSTGFV